MPKSGYAGLALALCLSITAHRARGGDKCESASDECVVVGTWNFSLGMGMGLKTNPLASGKDIPMVLIPQFSYYGKRFFIENLDVGYSLLEGDHNTVSLIATPGYDRVFFNNNDAQDVILGGGLTAGTPSHLSQIWKLPTRDKLQSQMNSLYYLGGLEWSARIGAANVQLDLLDAALTGILERDRSALQAHAKQAEIRGAVSMPLVATGRNSLTASLGATWQDSYYAYYFFAGHSAVNPFVTTTYSRALSKSWRINAFLEYERLGVGLAPNGLAHEYIITAFVGAYHDF